MNNARGKSSGKRTRTTSNKTNESLIQNVTSKVSGFLPFTISKWFGSPAQDNSANGGTKVPVSESTDSSSDDEEFVVSQPPVKKLRTDFQSFVSQKYKQSTNLEKNGKTDRRVVDTINNTEDFMESLPGPSFNYKRDSGLISTPIASFESKSDVGKLNTQSYFVNSKRPSQVASMASANKVRILNSEDTRNNASSMSSDFTPKLFCSDNKNLIPTKTSREATESVKKTPYTSPKKPTFKAAILGSPFYPGRTMYGGASAYNIIQIPNEPSFYQRRKPIVKPPPASSDNYMSQTAKRILDLLEDYSSPISEAKRIPYIGHTQNDSSRNNLNLGETSSVDSSIMKSLQANRTQEMRIPHIPALLKMRRRARLMDSTQAARQIAASQSSSISILPYTNKYENRPNTENTEAKYKSKIVNKRTRQSRKNDVETESEPVVNLPEATLSIDNCNLPKFSPILKSCTNVEKQEKVKPKDGFSFSTPIKVTDVDSVHPVHPLNNFTFSSPMKVDINGNKNSKEVPSKNNALNFRYDDSSIENTAAKPKVQSIPTTNSWGDKFKKTGVWSCSACWVENKIDSQKCIACDTPKPGNNSVKEQLQPLYTPKKVDVGDRGKDKMLPKIDATPKTTDSSFWGSSFVPQGNWQCKECWVSNKQNENKCVACGESKPGIESKPSANKLKSSWGEKFKNADGWKCKDCWVPNKKEDAKCIACGAVQPNTEVKATNPWVDKLKLDGNWQCPDCWVSNKADIKNCVACGALNMKLSTESTKPRSTEIKLPSNDSGFADIIKKQKEQWACTGCFTRNESNRLKCVCCEQVKPGEKSEEKSSSVMFDFNKQQTPQFKFGIQNTKPVENNNDKNTILSSLVSDKTNEKKSSTEIQSGFTFGIPAITKPKTDGFSFGIPASGGKTTELKDETPKSEATFNTSATTSKPELPKFDTFKAPLSLGADMKTTDQTKIDKNLPQTNVPKFAFDVPNTTEEKKDIVTPSTGYASFSTLSSSAPTFSFGLNTVTNKPVGSIDKPFSFGTTTSAAPTLEKPPSTTSTNLAVTVEATLSTVAQIPLVTSAPVTTTPMNIFANSVLTNNSNVVNCTPEKESTEKSSILGTELFPSTTPSSVNTPQKPVFSFGSNQESAAPKATGGFTFSFGSANASPAPTFNMSTSLPAAPAVFRSLQPENVNSGLGITKPALPSTGIFGAPAGETIFGAAPPNVQATPTATSASVFGASAIPSFNKTPATTTPNYFGNQQAAPTFNTSSTTPVFGSSSITPVPATNNMFGMPTQNQNATTNNQPSIMFGSPVQNSVTPAVFGSAAPSVNSNLGMFGNSTATPTFGAPAPVTFGDPTNATQQQAQAVPAFNFGSSTNQAAPVFGFGQQQTTPSVPVYNFGSPGGPQAPLQFNMGTFTGTSQPSPGRPQGRPMRKAVRRKPPVN